MSNLSELPRGTDGTLPAYTEHRTIGWDYPIDDAESFYCDLCGLNHEGPCRDDDESYGYDEDE